MHRVSDLAGGVLTLLTAAAGWSAARAGAAGGGRVGGSAVEHVERIASNFATLMADHWQELVLFGLRLVGWAAGFAAVAFLIGAVLGLVLYWLLRRRRLFDAPFAWYRYVRWAWPMLFVLALAQGLAYAGGAFGAGRLVTRAIRTEKLLDKVAANLLVAVFLDAADYAVTGEEKAEQLERVLADSEAVQDAVARDFGEVVRALAAESDDPRTRRVIEAASGEAIVSAVKSIARDVDPRLLVLVFVTHNNLDEYLAAHPDAHVGVAALSVHFETLREKACDAINGLVWPHVAAGVGLGVAVPILLLVALRLAVRWSARPAPA